MASRRADLGRLVVLAAVLAAVVAGCGGGSSSAPATDGGTSASTASGATSTPSGAASGSDSSSATAKIEAEAEKRAEELLEGNAAGKGGGGGGSKLKHPPIELPEGEPEKGPTQEEKELVPTASMVLKVPGGIAKDNTCKGKNVSPRLTWGATPSDAKELIVFMVPLRPVDGKLHFDWAMAGLDPSLEGLEEGEVPEGAILGRNGDGQNRYWLCPSGGGPEIYVFSVFAVKEKLSPRPGFEPLALRKAATRASDQSGLLTVTYAP